MSLYWTFRNEFFTKNHWDFQYAVRILSLKSIHRSVWHRGTCEITNWVSVAQLYPAIVVQSYALLWIPPTWAFLRLSSPYKRRISQRQTLTGCRRNQRQLYTTVRVWTSSWHSMPLLFVQKPGTTPRNSARFFSTFSDRLASLELTPAGGKRRYHRKRLWSTTARRKGAACDTAQSIPPSPSRE